MKSKVNRVVKCAAFLGLVLSAQLVAANGAAVSHSHNGRTHSHPLPSEGLSHSHGAGNGSPNNTLSGWVKVGDAGGATGKEFFLKKGSLEVLTNSFSVIGQELGKATRRVDLFHYVISFQDCKNQMGYLNNFNLSGKFVYKTEFVIGASSVASSIADVICGAGAKYL